MTSVQIGSKDMRAKESRCTSVTNHLAPNIGGGGCGFNCGCGGCGFDCGGLVLVVIIKIGQTSNFPSFNNYQWRFAEQ